MLGPLRPIIWISIPESEGTLARLHDALPRLFTPVDSLQCSLVSTTDRADRHPLAIHTMTGSLTALLPGPRILLGVVTPHPLLGASTLTAALAIRLLLRQSKIASRLLANLTVLMMSPRLLPVLRLVGQQGTAGLLPVWRPHLVLRLPSRFQRIIVRLPVLLPQVLLLVRVDRWVSVVRRAVNLGDPVVAADSEVVASEEGLMEAFEAVVEVVLGAVAECLLTAVEVVARVSIPESRLIRMLGSLRLVLGVLSPQHLLLEQVVGLPQPFVRGVTVPRPPTPARSVSHQTDNRSQTVPRRPRLPAPAPAVVHPTPPAQVFPPPVPSPE